MVEALVGLGRCSPDIATQKNEKVKFKMRFATVLLFVMLSKVAFSAEPRGLHSPVDRPFVQLLEATRFIANYKEMAAVSARVFGARAQGSDREYAEFMAKVAVAELKDVEVCMTGSYAAGPLSSTDAENLVQIFTSALGRKIVDLSQRMVIGDIERGFHKPIDPSAFTDVERRDLVDIHQSLAFQRYNALVSSQAFAGATKDCLASSTVGRASGVQF